MNGGGSPPSGSHSLPLYCPQSLPLPAPLPPLAPLLQVSPMKASSSSASGSRALARSSCRPHGCGRGHQRRHYRGRLETVGSASSPLRASSRWEAYCHSTLQPRWPAAVTTPVPPGGQGLDCPDPSSALRFCLSQAGTALPTRRP